MQETHFRYDHKSLSYNLGILCVVPIKKYEELADDHMGDRFFLNW